MHAYLVQYKDVNGSIFVVQIWKNATESWEMRALSKIETLSQTFTAFAANILTEYTAELEIDHICLIAPSHENP